MGGSGLRTAGLETEILGTRTVISASRDLPGDRMLFKATPPRPPLLDSGLDSDLGLGHFARAPLCS